MRDRMWLWGQIEGCQNGRWGFDGEARITPVEACRHLGIENLFMIKYNGRPEPPYDAYIEPFSELRRERAKCSAATCGIMGRSGRCPWTA